MVLEKLGDSLKSTMQKIAKAVFVDDKLLNELVKDMQRALLQSDVNVQLVFKLTNSIKERIKSEKIPKGLTQKEYLINVVYEELVQFMGGEFEKLQIKSKPTKLMLVGLFGSGKTTTAGKLARYYSKRGYSVALVGLDVHRPAAMDQLEQVAKKAGVTAFTDKNEKDPLKIWKKAEPELKKYNLVIVDTSGRDALSKDLIEEIRNINSKVKAEYNYLVISGDIGQAAKTQAEEFHESVGVNGVVATKMDGTAKAGGALSACAVTNAPIKFIGVGEGLDDLEEFNPKGFVSRLLGMGDLEALLDKAQTAISEEDAKDLGAKFLKGEFNLIDLYEQMQAMKKMGSFSKLMELMPGMGQLKLPKEALEVQEEKLEKWRHVMDSMTKDELEDPEKIDLSRVERIAKGSGCTHGEVRELIKQYKQSKKMMKMFKGGSDEKQMEKMMKKMQKGGLPGMFGKGRGRR